MKYSKQREMILNYIRGSQRHLTADTIYEILKKDNPSLSLGTVYRNLSQLVEHKMILKISIPGQPDCFEANLTNHFHLLCLHCGEVQDLFIEELNGIGCVVEKHCKVKVETFDLTIKGLCTVCKQEQNKN